MFHNSRKLLLVHFVALHGVLQRQVENVTAILHQLDVRLRRIMVLSVVDWVNEKVVNTIRNTKFKYCLTVFSRYSTVTKLRLASRSHRGHRGSF